MLSRDGVRVQDIVKVGGARGFERALSSGAPRRASGAGCGCPLIAGLDFLAVLGDDIEVPAEPQNRSAAPDLRFG